MNWFGIFLVLAGAGLIAGSRAAARITDRLNQRIALRAFNDSRAYIVVGIGLIILGAPVLTGLV